MTNEIVKFPNKAPSGKNILELFDNIQKLLDDPNVLKSFIDQQIEDKIIELSKGRDKEYETLLRQFQWGIQKELRKYKNQKVRALKANEMMINHAETLAKMSPEEMRKNMWKLNYE
jgi:hypothetical protein